MSTPAQAAAWNRAHPERHAASERRYRQQHPEVGLEYKRNMRIRAIDALGGKCCKCGFADYRALEVDHIFNGGCQDRRERSRYAMYRGIIDGTAREGFQALCANCHQIKTGEGVVLLQLVPPRLNGVSQTPQQGEMKMRKLSLAVVLFCGLALAAAPANAGVVRAGARSLKSVAKASVKVVKVAAKVAYRVAY